MLAGGSDLIDSVEVSFMVTGRPGVFTVELPLSGWRIFENGIDLSGEAAIIEAIYSL